MFLTTFFIQKDYIILLFYFIYTLLIFYATGVFASKYFNFEKQNFFFKFTMGFIIIFSINFFLYSLLSIFKINLNLLLQIERIKEFFFLFFLIFSYKNWINFNQKINLNFFKKNLIIFISLSSLFVIFYFSEKNLEWFNQYSVNLVDYKFYNYYFLSIDIKTSVLEVSREIYLEYFCLSILVFLVYCSFKSLFNQNNKNYLYYEILILALSIFFIFLLNLDSTTSEYYLVGYLFLYSIVLLQRKESYKTKNNIFNQLILLSIFLTIASTNWGIFYFSAFSISLLLYALYKKEEIYYTFIIFIFLMLTQLFFLIYAIGIIYGLIFLISSIILFYYPITSLLKNERKEELINFEDNLKKNMKTFFYILFFAILILNILFLVSNSSLFWDDLKDLLYIHFNSGTSTINLIFSILMFIIVIFLPVILFSYFSFYKKQESEQKTFHFFYVTIFALFFNPFTIVTFSMIITLNLNIGIYYILFLAIDLFSILNFVKNISLIRKV